MILKSRNSTLLEILKLIDFKYSAGIDNKVNFFVRY